MPFTFSHPAIVLPLVKNKRFFSATGLIVGSLTPDFEYFLKMRISSECSHRYDGLFYFDLPIGFLVCVLFHWIVRDAFIQNSPRFIQARIIRWYRVEWMPELKNRWWIVSISILIGAFSHIFWDEFTHVHGYFVEGNSTFLREINLLGLEMPLYKYLQHGSSLVGAVILAFWFFSLKRFPVKFQPKLAFWVLFFSVTIVVFSLRLWLGDWQLGIGNSVVSFISALMLGVLFSALVFRCCK